MLAWSLRNSKGSFTKGVNEISHALRAILVMNRRKRPLYPYGQKRLETSVLAENELLRSLKLSAVTSEPSESAFCRKG